MNTDWMEGNWNIIKGKVKEKWGKLTDDDLDVIRGKRDQLIGAIQKRYGFAREQAEREADEFSRELEKEPAYNTK